MKIVLDGLSNFTVVSFFKCAYGVRKLGFYIESKESGSSSFRLKHGNHNVYEREREKRG